ncbi:MAG: TfoX/Sxy family protein [Bacilli bacterium]|nr:TfoX/Sxy family protein [Bacilli bacterium]
MASSNDYLLFVLDLLHEIPGITTKKMMGEYLLYRDGLLFGGIYDNRFLVKKTASLTALNLREEIPYPGAKSMLLVDAEDTDTVRNIVEMVCLDLEKK